MENVTEIVGQIAVRMFLDFIFSVLDKYWRFLFRET
jgi:hypothetical protein